MPYSTDCNSGPSEFPESIVTVTLEFGPYLRADGSPVAQPISITPSVEVLDIESGAVIMALRPVTLRASQTRVILPATDSPGLSPIDFTYQVTIGGVPKVVSLPMAHPVVDFDLLVSSEPSPGTIIWHPPTLPSGGDDGDVLAWADAEDGGTRWMSPGEWPGVQRAEEAAQQAGEAAQQAEDARDGMVVGGTVDGDDLVLSTVGGDTIVAGNVRGQKGDDGDPGTASPEFLAGVQAAQDAQAGAEEARDEAEQSASQADASKTEAETAQGLAEDARTGAETARTGAETARTGAEQARDEAETAQGLADASRTGAETAQGLAEDARDGAVAARTGAETAQGLAEDARDAAQAANAATVTSGTVTGDDLILTRTDATTVNAGNVRGNAGPPNELAIGTVTTGAPGSAATASISGTAPSQVLNLTIPTGATGAVSTWEYYAAGRPDVVGTLDAAALAWRNAAPSGATFYSTDGPQGAWVWRKRGATWVCVEGDTGPIDLLPNLAADWTATVATLARTATGANLNIQATPAAAIVGASMGASRIMFSAIPLALWPFPINMGVAPFGMYGAGSLTLLRSYGGQTTFMLRTRGFGTFTDAGCVMVNTFPVTPGSAWPTTLTL